MLYPLMEKAPLQSSEWHIEQDLYLGVIPTELESSQEFPQSRISVNAPVTSE